jgi:metal-responsive CopG/Arc/MetJ family transcriptional regulator
MSVRYNMELPDALNSKISVAATEDEISKAEVIRKAIELYLVSRRAIREGNTVGIVTPENRDALKTEFVGL